MTGAMTRWRRRIGALVGGFEAGEASRRLRHFQPSRAHLNTLVAAAGADRWPEAKWRDLEAQLGAGGDDAAVAPSRDVAMADETVTEPSAGLIRRRTSRGRRVFRSSYLG